MEEKAMNVNGDTTANPTSGANDGTADKEKLFTQDEVNKIVSERLNRERQKAEPTEQETREAELSKRENRLECREYLLEKKYKEELLDILDISNADKFKETVEKLTELFPSINGKAPQIVGPCSTSVSGLKFNDPLADAFKPKT